MQRIDRRPTTFSEANSHFAAHPRGRVLLKCTRRISHPTHPHPSMLQMLQDVTHQRSSHRNTLGTPMHIRPSFPAPLASIQRAHTITRSPTSTIPPTERREPTTHRADFARRFSSIPLPRPLSGGRSKPTDLHYSAIATRPMLLCAPPSPTLSPSHKPPTTTYYS
jgi:hypothetical protein